MSSDYSTGLGTTTIKDSDCVIQQHQNKTKDNNLSADCNLNTSVHKDSDQSTHANHKLRNERKPLSYSLFERWTKNRKKNSNCSNHKRPNDEQSTTKNGSAYNFENTNISNNKNDKTLKSHNKSKLDKKRDSKDSNSSSSSDAATSRFQGIRVLFSKNKRNKKKASKKCKNKTNKNQKNGIKLQLDDEHETDEKNGDDEIDKNQDNLKRIKRVNEQIDQHRMRKSNTFSNLEIVKEQTQQRSIEINNNHNGNHDKRKKLDRANLKISNPSLTLLSPTSISSQIVNQTRRLSAHSEIHELSNSNNMPITPTSSTTNPFSSIQPVLVRTLGSNQVLTEQKATKVLGIVFFVFLFCWAPFFLHNFLHGVYPDLVINIPSSFVSFLQWLGYVSSTLVSLF